MKVHVDPDLCISCGACVDICPDVFNWNEDGIAQEQVEEIPEEFEDLAKEAVESCPTDAIMELSSAGQHPALAMNKD